MLLYLPGGTIGDHWKIYWFVFVQKLCCFEIAELPHVPPAPVRIGKVWTPMDFIYTAYQWSI